MFKCIVSFSFVIIIRLNNNNNIKNKKINRFYKNNETPRIKEGVIKNGFRTKRNRIKRSALNKRGSY